jgi:glutathione S-transferase
MRADAVADYSYPRIDGSTIILSSTAPAEPVTPTLAEVQSAKLTEVNAACTAAIEAGCDVTLSDGTAGHITLTLPDQINLSTAQEAIKAGGTGYAYHLDGALCEVYPAADIAIMAQAATAHVLYHQTYCNHVRAWVKRCTAIADMEAITYGGSLPDDLAAHMATIIAAAGGGGNA